MTTHHDLFDIRDQVAFLTRSGLVTVERRSPFDRRACWVREFSVDIGTLPH